MTNTGVVVVLNTMCMLTPQVCTYIIKYVQVYFAYKRENCFQFWLKVIQYGVTVCVCIHLSMCVHTCIIYDNDLIDLYSMEPNVYHVYLSNIVFPV